MKERKDIYFHTTDIDFINEIKQKNGIKTFAGALQFIINEYRKTYLGESAALEIAKAVNDEFDNRHKNELTRIRLASSMGDINAQVIIELLNTMLITDNTTEYFGTDVIEAQAVTEANKTVRAKIENYKQNKDNRK